VKTRLGRAVGSVSVDMLDMGDWCFVEGVGDWCFVEGLGAGWGVGGRAGGPERGSTSVATLA